MELSLRTGLTTSSLNIAETLKWVITKLLSPLYNRALTRWSLCLATINIIAKSQSIKARLGSVLTVLFSRSTVYRRIWYPLRFLKLQMFKFMNWMMWLTKELKYK